MKKYAIGVDIGGSHVCACAAELASGEIIDRSRISRKADCHDGAENIITVWSDTIRACVEIVGSDAVAGIGIAMPGPFDYVNGISVIEQVDKFDALYGLDVTTSLLSRLSGLGIREIRYTNDASAFALGEYYSGAGCGVTCMIALTLGTGVGSGFIDHGTLVTDAARVPTNGWVYNLPFAGSIADDQFSTRWFVRRYRELTGRTVEGVKEIAQTVESDPAAQRIFDEYGQRLADFVLPLHRNFRAQCVVLGGNIAQAYPLFAPALHKRLTASEGNIEFRTTKLHDNAVTAGAASLFK